MTGSLPVDMIMDNNNVSKPSEQSEQNAYDVVNVKSGLAVDVLSIWKDRRVLLVFLRHLGCPLCMSHIQEITSIRSSLEKYDITTVFIALGTLEASRDYIKLYGNPPGEFYISVDGVKGDINGAAGAYALLKLERGLEKVLGGKFKERVEEALAKGNKESPFLGMEPKEGSDPHPADVAQLGGVFIVGPGNFCEYSYRSAYGGDTPDVSEVLRYAKQSKKNYAKRFMSLGKRETASSSEDLSTSSDSDSQTDLTAQEGIPTGTKKFVYPRSQQWVNTLRMERPSTPVNKAYSSAPTNQTSTSNLKFEVSSSTPSLIMSSKKDAFAFLLIGAFGLSLALLPSKTALTLLVIIISFTVSFLVITHLRSNHVKEPAIKNVTIKKETIDISKTLLNEVANSRQPSSNKGEVRLFTPAEIDQLVIEAGTLDCDCSSVMMTIPLSGKVEVPVASDTSKNTPRSRSLSFLSKSTADALSNTELKASAQMLCFLREFLAKPHPLLGRKGPVCPFIPTALRKNTVYMAIVRTGPEVTPADIEEIVRPIAGRFEALEPTQGIMTSYKAVLMVFPDIDLSEAKVLIDGVQESLKPQFVSKGLMIGEFHKNNNASGLRNPDFYPLRTPVPTLAIRHMVTGDIAFLDMSKYAPDVRVSFLSNYIGRFQDDDSPRTVEMIERARFELEKAKTELASK